MLSSIKAKLLVNFMIVVGVIICFGLVVILKTAAISKNTVTFVDKYSATADLLMETRITFDEISNASFQTQPSTAAPPFG